MAQQTDRHDGRGPGSRHRAPRRRGRRIALILSAVLVVVLGAGGFAYAKLDGNLHSVDINKALGKDRPKKKVQGAENILVLGSDSRSGANRSYGGDTGGTARSDTAMVLHIAKGHKNASVISIPRDTVVDRPACTGPDGSTARAEQGVMFNTAYSVGGPSCAVKTVEQLSGVRMDHFVEVDFSGFKKLVDAIGGVTVNVPQNIDDNYSHLHITKGPHKLSGEQALGLVRTRHGIGDGSDLGRIQLQQEFIKALVSQVKSIGLLSNPGKLYDVADTATRALTTDSGLGSLTKLAGFAKSMGGIDTAHLKAVTMPVQWDPADPNRVVPIDAQTAKLWKAVRTDAPLPKVHSTAH